jgi:RHH-type transcriptional regulator, rel operon repressor / antitoxin RelB
MAPVRGAWEKKQGSYGPGKGRMGEGLLLMLAIRLPLSIEKRLEKLARRTGRTKTYYARQAILEHLEDLEDMYLAEGVLERIRDGEERTIPLKRVMKRHGLAG